jgi:hypothetical protein
MTLAFLGCQGDDRAATSEPVASLRGETTSGPVTTGPPTVPLSAKEKLLRWIRSCEARLIIFAHNDVTHVRFRGGAWVRLRLDDRVMERIFEAADAQKCDKRISVGIE